MGAPLPGLAPNRVNQKHRIAQLLFSQPAAGGPIEKLSDLISSQHYCIGDVPTHPTTPNLAKTCSCLSSACCLSKANASSPIFCSNVWSKSTSEPPVLSGTA